MGKTRRRKKHTRPSVEVGEEKIPKTFIVERGKVGQVLSQLVLDLRQVMEPQTASKLKVQQRNVLKDFVMVAGPLGVTHLLLLSRSQEYVNLKVCRLPRGPTLTFHVKSFALAREVLSSLKKPVVNPVQFLTPPMLTLSNLSGTDTCSHLLTTMFQNMLPSINVQNVNLATLRRCLLLHSDPNSNLIYLRHYGIRVVARGVSRAVKKLSTHSHLPNLGQLSDISDFVLEGYASESDGEELAGEGDVHLPQDLPGRGNVKAGQSAIRLSELGPRLSLQLVKIEAGLCGGEVLHHAFVKKSSKEEKKVRLLKKREQQVKEARRKQQEQNVARKKKEREENKVRSLAGMGLGQEEKKEEDEDVEWFKKEVGEEPDPDLFPSEGRSKKSKLGKRLSASSSSADSLAKKRKLTGKAAAKTDGGHPRDRRNKVQPKGKVNAGRQSGSKVKQGGVKRKAKRTKLQ